MDNILDIEDYIRQLMYRGITPEELISRITRCLLGLEDLFLARAHRNERNKIRACLAHSRMLYDHCSMMSSARTYLLRKIESLQIREQDLNYEINVLRNASSEEEAGDLSANLGSVQSFSEQTDRQISATLDRETILRSLEISERNLGNLSEEIAHKKKLLTDISIRIKDASLQTSCQDFHLSDMRISPLLSDVDLDPNYIPGSDKVGRTLGELRPRGGVPRIKTHISCMDMSGKEENISREFGIPDRLGDVVPGVVRSLSCEGYSHMGAACVCEDAATAAISNKNAEDKPADVVVQEVVAMTSQPEDVDPIGRVEEDIVAP